MRYFMMWLLGFLPGVGAGIGLLKLFITFAKNECMYIRDVKESGHSLAHLDRCPGKASKLCVENLCPTHCRQVHQEKCTQKTFRQNAA